MGRCKTGNVTKEMFVKKRNMPTEIAVAQMKAGAALLDLSREPKLNAACVAAYDEFAVRAGDPSGGLGREVAELTAVDRRIEKLRNRVKLQSPEDGDYAVGVLMLRREIRRRTAVKRIAKVREEGYLNARNSVCETWVEWARGRIAACEKLAEELGANVSSRTSDLIRSLMHVACHYRETVEDQAKNECQLKKGILSAIKREPRCRHSSDVSQDFVQRALVILDEHRKFRTWAARECERVCREAGLAMPYSRQLNFSS